MGKSMLVIDTPKSCGGCDFKGYRKGFNELCCMPLVNKLHTTKLISLNGIRKDCPLQDTTELLEALNKMMIPNLRYGEDTIKYKIYKVLSGEDN